MKIKLDTKNLSQEEKNQVVAAAYGLAFAAGENIVPTFDGTDLDFPGGSENLASVINKGALISKIASSKEANDVATAARVEKETEYASLLEEVGTAEAQFESMTSEEKEAVFTKLSRFILLRDELGR